jgi:hypothetical protein
MRTKILFILVIAFSLFSCSGKGNEGGDGIYPFENKTYLRFVSSAGTNVMDSLGILNMEEKKFMLQENNDLLSVTGTRMSDGEPLRFYGNNWLWASEKEDPLFPKTETLARIAWYDFNSFDMERRPYIYDEIYEIKLTSLELFGENVSHTLRWYATVKGKTIYAYKCEVDGKEVSLDNDPFYNYTSPYWTNYKGKDVTALIDIMCK